MEENRKTPEQEALNPEDLEQVSGGGIGETLAEAAMGLARNGGLGGRPIPEPRGPLRIRADADEIPGNPRGGRNGAPA